MRKFFCALAAVFALGFIGCASYETKVQPLTPLAIRDDINGLFNLPVCQYYLSKDITLNYVANSYSKTDESRDIRRTIIIGSSTPGILQTQNDAGESLDGYKMRISEDSGNEWLILSVLFDDGSDDNALRFIAYYDSAHDRFELASKEAVYDGLNYIITYEGKDTPYLNYQILENKKADEASRKVRGRTVGRR